MSRPEQPPRFFPGRSLGRKAVPEALRAGGRDLITLAEHYGMPADEQVADAMDRRGRRFTSHRSTCSAMSAAVDVAQAPSWPYGVGRSTAAGSTGSALSETNDCAQMIRAAVITSLSATAWRQRRGS